MPGTLTLLDNAELEMLERERAINLAEQTWLGRIMPLVFENTDAVMWDIRENVKALIPAIGIGDTLPQMSDTGGDRFAVVPGHYGVSVPIPAERIVRERKFGQAEFDPITVEEETSRIMMELAYRERSLMNTIRGRLLSLGEINTLDAAGKIKYNFAWGNYANQLVTYTSTDVWTDLANSKPLYTLRQSLISKGKGSGHEFLTPTAEMGANPVTWSYLWGNTNQADIGGKKSQYGATITEFGSFRSFIQSEAQLPTPVLVESAYEDTAGVWQYDIPDGYLVVVGVHASRGTRAGGYVGTKNASAMGRATIFADVDRMPNHPKLPRVNRSHSGAPRIDYGKQVVVFKVF